MTLSCAKPRRTRWRATQKRAQSCTQTPGLATDGGLATPAGRALNAATPRAAAAPAGHALGSPSPGCSRRSCPPRRPRRGQPRSRTGPPASSTCPLWGRVKGGLGLGLRSGRGRPCSRVAEAAPLTYFPSARVSWRRRPAASWGSEGRSGCSPWVQAAAGWDRAGRQVWVPGSGSSCPRLP